jgi:hypothetical protein
MIYGFTLTGTGHLKCNICGATFNDEAEADRHRKPAKMTRECVEEFELQDNPPVGRFDGYRPKAEKYKSEQRAHIRDKEE